MADFANLMGFFSGKPPAIKPTQEMGVSGTTIVGGYIQVLERNPRIVGTYKYQTYSEIFLNTSIVAAGIRYFLDLTSKPAWTVKPADESAQAKELANFAETCLYDLSASWARTVRKAAEFRFHGFGLQEWTAKNRDDGRIGIASLEARPQHTIYQWDVDENGTVNGAIQRHPLTMQEFYLPRGKVVYLVDDTLTDSPEGSGIFRHLVDPAERLKAYLGFEASGFETDLRGIPIGYAPLSELANAVKRNEITKEQAEALKKPLKDFIDNHIRSRKSGLMLDSATYRDVGDNQSPSNVPLWKMELAQGGSTSFGDIGKAINRINHELAVILGCENMLLGSGGQSGGSRALSQDKSEHMYLVANSCLGDIAEGMRRDFIGPLWTLNGFPEELKPKLEAEEVQYKDVTEVTTALQQMAQAGALLAPDDPAIDDVRSLLGLSAQPKPDASMMGVRAPLPTIGDVTEEPPAPAPTAKRRKRSAA